MTRPEYSPTISLGSVLQIAGLLITLVSLLSAGIWAFATLDGKATSNMAAIATLTETADQHDGRIRANENNFARSDERLTSIFQLLTRIDSRLERIEQGR